MSLSLAALPAEVLAEITSSLSNFNVTFLLPLCGNKLLTSKLRQGGISTVVYPSNQIPYSHTEFLHSCRLLSVTLSNSKAPIPVLKRLILGLPSTLKCLKVNHHNLGGLLVSNDLDLEESPFPVSGTDHRPWIVSKTFPLLETLDTLDSTSYLSHYGDKFNIDFLAGLPASITHLCIPLVTNRLKIDLWRFLPPSTTQLNKIINSLPSKYSSPHLMANLRSLEIGTELPSGDVSGEKETLRAQRLGVVTFPRELVWPPHLTLLSLTTPSQTEFSTIPTFPSTLTRLSWSTQLLKFNHPAVLLQAIPASIIHLSISMVQFTTPPPDTDHVQIVLKALRTCSITFSTTNPSSPLHRPYLLRAFHWVEELNFAHRETDAGLSPSELALLNPSTVRSLKACLSKACFNDVDDSFELSLKLPNLTSLSLLKPEPSMFVFTFAAIPRSVTELDLGDCSISTQTMNLLPPGLKLLKGSQLMAHGTHNFETLFFEPIAARLAEARPSSHHSHWLDLTRFDPARHHMLDRYDVGSGSNTSTRFWLRSVDVKQFPWERWRPANNANIRINWDRTLALPSTLTSLRLPPTLANIQNSILTPALLPCVTSLRVDFGLDIDYGAFEQLTSLHFDTLRKGMTAHTSRCPPNLTSLRCDFELQLPSEFLPLPESLTELIAGHELSPLSELLKIPNLQSFGCRSAGWTSGASSKLLNSLPTTLRNLEAVYESVGDLNLSTVASRFNQLDTLKIKHPRFSLRLLINIELLFPENTRFIAEGTIMNLDAVDYVLERAGFDKGCIKVDADAVGFVARGLTRAFPRWSGLAVDRTSMLNFPTLDSWAAFTHFLAPDLAELDLERTITVFKPGFAAHLPRNITKLIVEQVFPESPQLTVGLPPSLTHLVITAREFTATDIEAIPRGVTDLELRQLKTISLEMIAALPPTLLRLILYANNITEELLRALPRTLVSLGLKNGALIEANFEALPPNLKTFEGSVETASRDFFFAFAKRRGIVVNHSTYSSEPVQLSDDQLAYIQRRFDIPLDSHDSCS